MKKETTGSARLTLSWRIGLRYLEREPDFRRLLDVMRRNPGTVDEVALFDTHTHHLYVPLDVYAARMSLFKERLAAFRSAGIRSAGINVLCTIGHVNEAWSYNPPLPFQPMVGHDGSVSRGCACPNTPAMREYVRGKYRLAAEAGPDFIWVDDDIRLQHHGVTWGCFCPACLDLFRRRSGRRLTRDQLVAAFDKPAGARLRALWVEQNRATLESLMADIASVIHAVDPKIGTGLMTAGPGWTTYSGQSLDRWCRALRATKGRPGGGFYSDATPGEMVRKAVEVARQDVAYPPAVTDRQYELENFPYQALKKSRTALKAECTLALASGLNGIAFNLTAMGQADFEPYVPAIAEARASWERLVAHAAGLPVAGLWAAWSADLMARRSVRKGERWLDWSPAHDTGRPVALAELGLPIAPANSNLGTLLTGRVMEALTDHELKTVFRGGVLMDGSALEALEARGFGAWAGVRLGRRLDNGLVERLTDDPLNGGAAGAVRDARIEFWGDARGQADVLEPLAEGVRVLARHETYTGDGQGIAMTAFENALGGRVVVAGYAPWMFIHSAAKRLQLQNVADWITRDRMPVRVEETVPLLPFVRMAPDRKRALIVLLNAGLDPIRSATVRLRLPVARARLVAGDGKARDAVLVRKGAERILNVKGLAPWSTLGVLL